MNTSELTSSTEAPNAAQNPAKDLLTLLRKNNAAEDIEDTTDNVKEKTPMNKLEHKREIARRCHQKRKDELTKLRANQIHGICILLTQPDGKILTHRLATETDYIDFITSIFETYKLEQQVVDFRVLPLEALGD